MGMSSEKEIMIKKWKALWADSRSFWNRFAMAGFAMAGACFTVIFFGPFEMVAFSGESLVYTYKDVLGILLLATVAVWFLGSLLIAVFRGKIYNYIVSVVFTLTVGSYVQTSFLNGSIGTLTGDAVHWTWMKADLCISLLVWVAILIVVLTVMYLHRKFWKRMVAFVSASLVIMQLVPTIFIVMGLYEEAQIPETSNYYLSDEGMGTFSSTENIFVFVVDFTDFDYIERVYGSDPEIFDRLDGFTAYTDAVSVFGRTNPGICNLLTGYQEGAYLESRSEFYRKAWRYQENNIFDILQREGYAIELYGGISDVFSEMETPLKYVSNVKEKTGMYDKVFLLRKLMYYSAYRYAPLMLKPFFHEDTNFYNEGIYTSSHSYQPYVADDVATAEQLRTGTADRTEKSFKLFHLEGSHPPCYLNEEGRRTAMETSEEIQTMGCFTLLNQVFDHMKDLGIYEDATIIITADHGEANKMWEDAFEEMRIALFYKPSGRAEAPLVWSDAQVSSKNLPATIVKATGAEYAAFGEALDDVPEGKEMERTFFRVFDSKEKVYEIYKIVGSAKDFLNWEMVDSGSVMSSFV